MTQYVLERTLISDLAEATSVTSADWLIVLKDGQVVANKTHPGGVLLFSAANPVALGSASPGTAATPARSDHVHPFSGGSNSVNFNCNLLQVNSGYIYRYTTDNVANITLGDLSTAMYFRNDVGHIFWTLDDSWAFIRCGDLTCHAIAPRDNDTYDLGSSGKKWDDIYATNGNIETSDARAKTDIAPSDLGLDFVMAMKPVKYRRYRPKSEYIDESDTERRKRTLPEKRGTRPHYGLLAQDVKQALGARDFAGYVYDETTDVHGLRYSEFIAPLIRAVQELTARVEELERAGKRTPRA